MLGRGRLGGAGSPLPGGLGDTLKLLHRGPGRTLPCGRGSRRGRGGWSAGQRNRGGWDCWDGGKQSVVVLADSGQVGRNILVRANGRAKNDDPLLLEGDGPVTNPNRGGVGGRLGPARRWGAVRIPDACLAMVQRDIGFLLEGLLQPFIKGAGAGCRAEEVDIVEISQDGLTRLERLVGLVEGGGDRGGEQAWHEGVSLFAPFVLENAVSSAAGIYQMYSEGVL